MKTNCIGVAELLCAYADGELEVSKIHIVEDHLLICENCSAILKLYKEISSAIDETNVPAPEILRPGVMNRIQHEEIYTDTVKIKKRKQYHFVLTRFAPVAACLLVGLLIWQPWGNSLIMRSDSAMPAGAPMADSDFYGMTSVPAPEAAQAFDYESQPEELAVTSDSDMSEATGGGRAFDDSSDDDGMLRALTVQDIDLLLRHIDGAYAEITITGELPLILERYMPQAIGPWFEWDMVLEIPSTEIPALLNELADHEDFTLTTNDQNASSEYAMVFFSHKE